MGSHYLTLVFVRLESHLFCTDFSPWTENQLCIWNKPPLWILALMSAHSMHKCVQCLPYNVMYFSYIYFIELRANPVQTICIGLWFSTLTHPSWCTSTMWWSHELIKGHVITCRQPTRCTSGTCSSCPFASLIRWSTWPSIDRGSPLVLFLFFRIPCNLCSMSLTWTRAYRNMRSIQWNLIIKSSDITKPYNKVILPVSALYISLFVFFFNPDVMRNLI